MRKPKIIVVVSVSHPDPLTPKMLQSIGAKLERNPVAELVYQVRKKHTKRFQLDVGNGVIVTYPPPPIGGGLRITVT